jgi:TIR domain
MSETFKYDVFISHSSKDKPAVRELAERLRRDGLRVWFDEWEIEPGDPIVLKIEEGLAQSRTLVLAMSANAYASDWVTMERHTVMFRDPTNEQRRFIPVRMDDADIKDPLKHFSYIDWRHKENEQYERLLRAIEVYNPRSRSGEDTFLSDIRKKLITAQSRGDLQTVLFEAEAYLARHPYDVEARLVKRQIESAIVAGIAPPMAPSVGRIARYIAGFILAITIGFLLLKVWYAFR